MLYRCKNNLRFRKTLIAIGCTLLLSGAVLAQRQMENPGRGLVAVSSNSQVFISCRIPGPEFNAGTKYNPYREGTLIASSLNVSNYVDSTGTNSTYQVAVVMNGTGQAEFLPSRVNVNTHRINARNDNILQRQISSVGDYARGALRTSIPVIQVTNFTPLPTAYTMSTATA